MMSSMSAISWFGKSIILSWLPWQALAPDLAVKVIGGLLPNRGLIAREIHVK